jgi:hypothetical protein
MTTKTSSSTTKTTTTTTTIAAADTLHQDPHAGRRQPAKYLHEIKIFEIILWRNKCAEQNIWYSKRKRCVEGPYQAELMNLNRERDVISEIGKRRLRSSGKVKRTVKVFKNTPEGKNFLESQKRDG